ncbi:MAG: LacI family DNA-binding transcriptional regulator [Pseudomonadota bacterium]
MNRRPTIIDVARAAGVSKSTVSLVLRQSPLVKSDTREAIERAMAEIGYVYNRSAAQLRGAGAGLVGLVINDLRNPFFTEFATSIQMALSGKGYATVIANTDEDTALQAQVVGSMIEHGVSAFVISPAYGDVAATFDQIARAGIPTLQVLRRADPRIDIFPFSSPDSARGGRLATRHLVEAGARRIAFFGGVEGRQVTAERMSGYLQVMQEQGLAPRAFHGRASRAFGRDAARRVVREGSGIDGAMCFNDLVALGMLAGFAEQGVAVGRDILVVGFDDIEDCAMAFPPLSSVRCDIAGFARATADRLAAWIEDGTRPPPELRSPVDLVIRASSRGAA